MKNNRKYRKHILTAVVLALFLNFSGCRKVHDKGIAIIASTTMIGAIAETIGKDNVNIISLVPGGMCPGHFDIKFADIETLSRAKVLLNHGWEKWIADLVGSVENKELNVETIKLEGNWMVPDIHIQAIEKITGILCKIDMQNREVYKNSSKCYKEAVNSETERIRKLMRNLQGAKVVCSKHQEEFCKWLGLKIVATYGRAEEMSPKELAEIIESSKSKDVKLVIDNLQSGTKMALQISEEIGAGHVVLTNFPVNNSYIETLKENVNKIIRVLTE